MNFKQKLGYMLIGCLFTITGYILASLGGDTTHAQQNEQVIDKIVCRELQVVNTEGTTIAIIQEGVGKGGRMEFRNTAGKVVTAIGPNKDGMDMEVYNTAGKKVVRIGSIDDGGIIEVYNVTGKVIANIRAYEDGNGVMGVHNSDGHAVAGMKATKSGNGMIQSYDGGWRIH